MSDPREPKDVPEPRLGPLARLPVFFSLDGKRTMVVGGSAAEPGRRSFCRRPVRGSMSMRRTVRGASAACGRPAARRGGDQRAPLAARGPEGAAIAIGAFDDDESAAAFAAAARAAGVPVNVIDKPAFCDFSFGAIVNRSPLVIGISTDGAAPVFAQAIRAKLEALLPKGFADWAAAAARWRGALKSVGLSFAARRKFWQIFTAYAVANPDRAPAQADFDSFVAEVKGLGAAVESGSVTLVGAGPGDPDADIACRAGTSIRGRDFVRRSRVARGDGLRAP